MASLGKHARADEPSQKIGKHAGEVRVSRDRVQILVTLVLLAAVAIVPFSFNRLIVAWDSPTLGAAENATFSEVANPGVSAPEKIIASYDGPLSEDTVFFQGAAPAIIAPPATYTENVSEKLQAETMAGGCEFISLDIVLDAMGLETDIHEMVAEHVTMDGHFATGYTGDPYGLGGGYPAGIIEAANSYLSAQNKDAVGHDLTGVTFKEMAAFVERGYPILVWTTMGYEDPEFAGTFDNGKEWYYNEHCVVFYGFNEKGDKVLVSDPLEGLIECDKERFAELFEACGSMAAVIY